MSIGRTVESQWTWPREPARLSFLKGVVLLANHHASKSDTSHGRLAAPLWASGCLSS